MKVIIIHCTSYIISLIQCSKSSQSFVEVVKIPIQSIWEFWAKIELQNARTFILANFNNWNLESYSHIWRDAISILMISKLIWNQCIVELSHRKRESSRTYSTWWRELNKQKCRWYSPNDVTIGFASDDHLLPILYSSSSTDIFDPTTTSKTQ